MTKQEKIKETYGEHWEAVKNMADDNGFVNGYVHFDGVCGFKKYETEDNGSGWRPKSLQGIENNNGWIKIESESDLPTIGDDMEFYVILDGEMLRAFFMEDSKRWYEITNLNLKLFPSHYQPIVKPQPPLY